MKAIILSAGQGSRLLPLTQETPKCCLPVHGKSILEWQLHQIEQTSIDEVVVVTGFAHEKIEHRVANYPGLKVQTVFNPFYSLADNLGSCWIVQSHMQEPFVIINGDTLFEAEILNRLITNKKTAPITVTSDHKSAYDDDDMKIITSGGRLLRVGKTLALNQVNGESIGMVAFDRRGAEIFRNKVDQLMRQSDGVSRWYFSAIDELAQQGHVGFCSIHGMSWCEVDDLTDLKLADYVVAQWSSNSTQSSDDRRKTPLNKPQVVYPAKLSPAEQSA